MSEASMNRNMPSTSLTPESQIAVMAQQMSHLIEKIDTISRQQEVFISMTKSVAVHDERLAGVEQRVGNVEGRLTTHSDLVMERLQDISHQITNSSRVTEEKNNSAVVRVHERLDIQDSLIKDKSEDLDDAIDKIKLDMTSRINPIEITVAEAKGSLRTGYWVMSSMGAVFLALVMWVFTQIGTAHDENIRHDERIKVIEQAVKDAGVKK